MKTKVMLIGIVLCGASLRIYAQRHERRGPLTLRDQMIMKLDSIDQIYLSRFHGADHFGAKRKLDGVLQLFDKREMEIHDREQAMKDKEQDLDDREQDLEDREQALKDRESALQDRGHARDRDIDRNKENVMDRDKGSYRISAISVDDLNQLSQTIDNASFAQDKKKVFKTSVTHYYFTVDQVIHLASKFSFDNDRLDIVELAYPKIIDLDKNYLLYNCFTFSDAKSKLEKFIDDFNKNPGPK